MLKKWLLKLLFKGSNRLVVVGSLLPIFAKNQVDEDTLKKVNTALGLAKDIRALKLPMEMSKDIWDEEVITLIQKLSSEEHTHESLVDLIYKHTPEWLRYDYTHFSKDAMVIDSIGKSTQ
jgi:hypothetical protein